MLPRILEPARGESNDLVAFARERRASILEALTDEGAVLLRGFAGTGVAALERAAETLAPPLMEYQDRAAHRKLIAGRVYTSAD